MVNFTLAGDDWFAIFPESHNDSRSALVTGRWLMPLVWAVTGNGAFVPYFSFAVALALLVLAGLVAAAAWRFTRPWAVFAVVTLFVVNPLFTDTLNFKPAHVSFPLAVLCATGAGWVILRWAGARLWRVTVAALLLVLSLASYQPTILAFAVVVIGGEVIGGRSEGTRYWREARWRWCEIVVAVVASVVLYLLSVRLAWWATGTRVGYALPRYSLTGGYPSTAGELAGALRYGLRLTGRFWFGTTTLYPIMLKLASLGLIVAGIVVSVATAGRGPAESRAGRAARGAWLGLLGVASVVVPFAVLFIRDEPPLRGNVFTTVGLVVGFWAGLLLDGVAAGAPSRRRRLVGASAAALVLMVVLGCAFQVNKGFFGLYLSNQRDLANANRMLSVMEEMPEFTRGRVVKVELVGRVRFQVPAEPFSNREPDLPGLSIVDCSGLACQDRLVYMLNLIGGGERAFVRRSVSEDPAVMAVIATMPGWPEPGSIRFLEDVFVVKGGASGGQEG
ncbi:MAG TPA: glucosyltransferase domain-containing protein [Acidimicrobiia bacterium]|nr:glucosyltransferase domain-containing protein [Acidimicrobiia bacterium]